jgi:hypothetical protein
MKNSETDRVLIDLIKDTLDNYEEQYILGSWENFVRRRKRRKKLILWFTCTGIAASLLIGWLGFRFIISDSFSSNAGHQQSSISNLQIPVEKETLKEHILIRQVQSIPVENKKTRGRSHDQSLQSTSELQNKNHTLKENLEALNIPGTGKVNTSVSPADTFPLEKNIANSQSDTVNTGLSSTGSTADKVSSVSEVHRSDTSVNKPVYRQAGVKINPENDLPDNKRSQKVRLGVNLSPGVTSTNTASSFNYSGGINADFYLSRSFRLSTGLQVEHHNVINESSDNPAWIPSGETLAELVDLDLPLNLTWKFLIRKSTCYYLSGGISSVIYLSENYTRTVYTQKMVQTVEMSDGGASVTYQLENVKTTEQETEAPLSTFDFAGRINIIFGFEQHLSSRLFLHLEPYIKIPVSELAAQNLRFTTSGITCKISF